MYLACVRIMGEPVRKILPGPYSEVRAVIGNLLRKGLAFGSNVRDQVYGLDPQTFSREKVTING